MKKNMSSVLIETVVRTALKGLKDDPERSIRNLVDLARRFSGDHNQQLFFTAAQTLLQNEASPYYGLVRDVISYADSERLLRFGMDLGYNSCTYGARQIRGNEKRLGYHIPWTVLLQMDDPSGARLGQYDAALTEGEKLGIYTWMLFPAALSGAPFELARRHPDSAFFLFCEPEQVSPAVLDGLSDLKNVLPVLRCREDRRETYARLRAQGIPYAVYISYAQEELAAIRTGDLFADAQQARGFFTALIPRRECPEDVREQVCRAVEQARSGQLYQTIPWELEWDNRRVDGIISERACCLCLDPEGFPLDGNGFRLSGAAGLFDGGLGTVLQSIYPGRTPVENMG